jgi:nucleoside-diphosphate-sugar epimerase
MYWQQRKQLACGDTFSSQLHFGQLPVQDWQIDEETSLALDAPTAIADGIRTIALIERRLLAVPNLEGIVLRYGFFYGPGTWYAPDGDIAKQVRQQQFPIVANGKGVWSRIHVEDAAIATAKAVEQGNPGVYIIADEQPLQMSVWLPAYARWLNAPPPIHVSVEQALKAGGAKFVFYGTQLRGVSNAKAKRELGFQPRPLEWLVENTVNNKKNNTLLGKSV